jgi:hypothetical protein
MNRKRQILEDFLNGRIRKLIKIEKNSPPPIIVIESKKEGIAEIYHNGELLEIPFNEIDNFLANNMPKRYLLLDYARPITREEIERNQSR